jgi:solute carrier family 9B (sodium/hydrogen exchanger), member 1/2
MIQSIALILALGLLADRLFRRLGVPGLLGMILIGILLGPFGLNLLDRAILDNSADIRMLALVVILLRAGLGLNKEMLNRVGRVAITMSAIPCLMEGALATLAAHLILGLPLVEAGLLGFILAAVSPAVVVPSMLRLKEQGLGMDKGIPVLILAGASVDDVFAITLFTAFLGMALQSGQSIVWLIAQIPLQVVGGIVLGALVGYGLYRLYALHLLNLARMEQLALILIAALAVVFIGQKTHIAGLLAVMTLGFVVLEKDGEIAERLERDLDKIWFFAQILLFVLIGAEVNVGIAWQAGAVGLLVLGIGLIGRLGGVMVALLGSNLERKERLFCAVAYSPKATVQAAIGGIPLAMGVESGALILAIAVLAIMVTAPLGALGIDLLAPRLLSHAAEPATPKARSPERVPVSGE